MLGERLPESDLSAVLVPSTIAKQSMESDFGMCFLICYTLFEHRVCQKINWVLTDRQRMSRSAVDLGLASWMCETRETLAYRVGILSQSWGVSRTLGAQNGSLTGAGCFRQWKKLSKQTSCTWVAVARKIRESMRSNRNECIIAIIFKVKVFANHYDFITVYRNMKKTWW